jgi:hypothetical protein
VLAVAGAASAEIRDRDPARRRLELWSRWLKYPLIASLACFAAGIALAAIWNRSWLILLAVAAIAWFAFARLAIRVWRELHLSDYRWRLDRAPPRERTLLLLAQRAVWPWPEQVPEAATHAVLVADEIGGHLQVESFLDWNAAQDRVERRVDLLAGERSPVVVALVELDAEAEQAVIEVVGGRIEGRRPLDSLPEAEDGWLVGV